MKGLSVQAPHFPKLHVALHWISRSIENIDALSRIHCMEASEFPIRVIFGRGHLVFGCGVIAHTPKLLFGCIACKPSCTSNGGGGGNARPGCVADKKAKHELPWESRDRTAIGALRDE
jgi:hypothetical protein